MIDLEELTKRFGDVVAVDGLTLHVNEGEIFGFLGPNGAGKTTTVRMLTGLISKTSGEARVGGFEIGREEDRMKIRGMVGLLPENVGLIEELSPVRNLDFYGRLYDCPDDRRRANIERLLTMLDLWDQRDRPVATFSKGMKQKVAVARALVHDPRVLFLDEPTANLDPEATRTVRDVILQLKREDRTIVLTTHNLYEAQRICDRVAIVKSKLVTVGSPDELRSRFPSVRTVLRLERVTEPVLAAVRARIGTRSIVAEGNSLIVGVSDPARENPDLVEAVVAAGGRVQQVTELEPSLEDAYLSLVHQGEGG